MRLQRRGRAVISTDGRRKGASEFNHSVRCITVGGAGRAGRPYRSCRSQ
jgi:hypothetical protein